MITRPMLAARIEEEQQLKFPMLVSPKWDGIRCIQQNGIPLSRKFKGIPNKYITYMLRSYLPGRWFDGELVIPGSTFHETQSAVMSREGEPNFEYHVFDYAKNEAAPFSYRLEVTERVVNKLQVPWLKVVHHQMVRSMKEFTWWEANYLGQGFEGIMGRHPDGLYKSGRSTVNQAWLIKLKRFEDSEAKVIGYKQWEENTNPQEVNELGLHKRSHKKSGMVLKDTLGALIVKDIHGLFEGQEFGIGTGFDDSMRNGIWSNREYFLGRIVNYKYQKQGTKDLPRFPTFRGFRHEDDQ